MRSSCFAVVPLTVTAATGGAARLAAQSGGSLAQRIERVMNRPEFKHAEWGVEFYSLDTNKPVYAHNPDASAGKEAPAYVPKGRTARRVQMGNLGSLMKLLTKYYGRKHLWITEYGYQTKPPDAQFGVSWALQAKYLTQAFAIARRNPRIGMMLWFLVRDEPDLSGWQSVLITTAGRKKPAYSAFLKVPRSCGLAYRSTRNTGNCRPP